MRSGGTRKLACAAAVANADWYAVAPLLPVLPGALGTDLATVTLALGAHTLGYGLALPVWGRLADGHGPRAVLRAGLALAAVALAACALTWSATVWLALRALTGAGFAAVTPATALFLDPERRAAERQRGHARLTAAAALTAVVAPLLIGAAARPGMWRLSFVALAAATALIALATRDLPHLPPPRASRRPPPVPDPQPGHLAARRGAWDVAPGDLRPVRSRGAFSERAAPTDHPAAPHPYVDTAPPPGRPRLSAPEPPPRAPRGFGSSHPSDPAPPPTRPPRRRGWWTLVGVGAAEGAVLLVVPALLPAVLATRGAGAAATAVVIVYGVSVWAASQLVRRSARRRSAQGLLVLGGLFAVAACALASCDSSTGALLASAALLGAAWGHLHIVLQAWVPYLLPDGERATAASVFATAGMLAGALGTAAAAPLVAAGRDEALFGAATALGVLLTACAVSVPRLAVPPGSRVRRTAAGAGR
ncbi:MFS transporter [Streptomyces sp. NPDC001595]|uniref:MFS transporter n=1 Tax=Streptomyces sp. NPDC001532 TaxID=3154520 RepID=UPI00332B11D8